MFGPFTDEARSVVAEAHQTAHRMGHPFLGCEHMVLSCSASAGPAGEVLREHGLSPAAVEASIRRLLDADDGIDAAALADIGIDLDTVRERIEATFGPGALAPARLPQRRFRRRRKVGGHLPLTGRATACLRLSAREAHSYGEGRTGVEHLVLALTSITGGLAPRIARDLGVEPAAVHDELARRLGARG
jgi:ATP-dependent Clp protease ATP-binding subunit ClpA